MLPLTRVGMIRARVASGSDKIRERRLRWLCTGRRDKGIIIKRDGDLKMRGKRRKLRWTDVVKKYISK